MNCLFSSHAKADKRDEVEECLRSAGFNVTNIFSKDDLINIRNRDYDLLISDRTQFLFPPDFINSLSCPRINTHPSLLPYHKGSQPVFWASILNHKLGVSLHSIDAALDSGEIYMQSEVIYDESMTFSEVHQLCRKKITESIKEIANTIISGEQLRGSPQPSYCNEHHRLKESLVLLEKLPNRWNTKIRDARRILSVDLEEMHIIRTISNG